MTHSGDGPVAGPLLPSGAITMVGATGAHGAPIGAQPTFATGKACEVALAARRPAWQVPGRTRASDASGACSMGENGMVGDMSP